MAGSEQPPTLNQGEMTSPDELYYVNTAGKNTAAAPTPSVYTIKNLGTARSSEGSDSATSSIPPHAQSQKLHLQLESPVPPLHGGLAGAAQSLTPMGLRHHQQHHNSALKAVQMAKSARESLSSSERLPESQRHYLSLIHI